MVKPIGAAGLTGGLGAKFFKSLGRLVAPGMLALALIGCNPTEFGQKQIADPSKIGQIQKGVSTKASIKAAFGDPQGIDFQANGDEVTKVPSQPRQFALVSALRVEC